MTMTKKVLGVSLVEVLVALLMLSVGLLGFAALQLQSLRFTNDTYLQSQGEILLYDMADRLRLNANVARGGNYVLDFEDPILEPTRDCMTLTCTGGQLAEYDLWWFQTEAQRALSDGKPSIQMPDPDQPGELILAIRYFLQGDEENADGDVPPRVTAIEVNL